MFHLLEKRIAEAFAVRIQSVYNLSVPVQTEQPKQSSFGEIAVPAAFQLARQLKKAPKVTAAELAQSGQPIEGVAAIEIAGNGYLNIRLDRGYYGYGLLAGEAADRAVETGKIIVEHTNINPNKAAHIGHLRNAVLGDTFVRLLRRASRRVEVQNYIDNTGVQVADVVVGFQHIERKSTGEVRALAAAPLFDYLCWDLYARVTQFYEEDKARLTLRGETLAAIEEGHGPAAEL
ncbi:MAG TPA: arginine--tRNA ligase, partial [Bryobacteraceae bacterium]|nr:arginine--tRNA ligase [Bryobacteraceae bacterium]